ncbi:F-box protein CPR1-like protein [Tanacetum coccineum]
MVLFDATEEVLLRLTVKDVLRCKSVCKSWYSLISSPSFVKLHLKHVCKKEEKNNKQLGNRRIALTSRYEKIGRNGSGCHIPDEWRNYATLDIEGSSNGLVCISSYDNRLSLTNPSTREFRKLHKPPILPKDGSYAQCYGFGYDSSADDYKLVMTIDQRCDGTLVQILSLKSNVWKVFGHVNYSFSHDTEPGILFNGALHWFWYNANDMEKVSIVSFDLAKEQFKEIPQPDDTRYVWSYDHELGIFEDHLCIFLKRNGRPYGIWVMKNYNVKQSWKLLPTDCEMKDRVHYMIKDSLLSKKMPSYFCCENIFLSTSGKHIWSPIFVQTLVSPYVNNHGRPSDAKKNKRTVEAGSSKEWREIEEAYTLKDGDKNAFHRDEDGEETERKKRKRTRSTSSRKRRFKGDKSGMGQGFGSKERSRGKNRKN